MTIKVERAAGSRGGDPAGGKATIGLNTAGLDTLDFAGPEIDRMRDDEGKARLKEGLIREAYEWTKYKLQ